MTATGERARDTFVAFVDVLADTLDEPDVSSDDLAGRLYLSRFHADPAAAEHPGEPPGALPGCVLLERAAYRLVTTRAGVLHVAIEAWVHHNARPSRGCCEPRAYGVAPRDFRARPR